MTVWAVLDKDGKVLVLVTTPELARRLAEGSIPRATVEEMAVLS